MDTEVLVVGAGISGLACARKLVESGKRVVVLEKSRGVGGRCATRRIADSIVDHGLAFYHGDDADFRAALVSAGGENVVEDWPRVVRGRGAPCRPTSFRPGEWRLAFADGVTLFPKHLGADLDVRLQTRVRTVESAEDHWRVVDDKERVVTARDLVLAVPPPQGLNLLNLHGERPRELASLEMLLREIGFVSTLTLLALYPTGGPLPDWEMCYPEDSAILQLISHDSSKRNRPERTVLVLQALPAWSRRKWEVKAADWSAAMLAEAGRLAGRWAAEPETVQIHRWRFARIGSGGDLARPMMVTQAGGRRLAFVGDGFHPGGGVQAAWRAGDELAQRILEER